MHAVEHVLHAASRRTHKDKNVSDVSLKMSSSSSWGTQHICQPLFCMCCRASVACWHAIGKLVADCVRDWVRVWDVLAYTSCDMQSCRSIEWHVDTILSLFSTFVEHVACDVNSKAPCKKHLCDSMLAFVSYPHPQHTAWVLTAARTPGTCMHVWPTNAAKLAVGGQHHSRLPRHCTMGSSRMEWHKMDCIMASMLLDAWQNISVVAIVTGSHLFMPPIIYLQLVYPIPRFLPVSITYASIFISACAYSHITTFLPPSPPLTLFHASFLWFFSSLIFVVVALIFLFSDLQRALYVYLIQSLALNTQSFLHFCSHHNTSKYV